jgi:predicted MPP superfamily phosphohydrolase
LLRKNKLLTPFFPELRFKPRFEKAKAETKKAKAMKKIIHLSDTHIGFEDMSSRMADMVTRIIFTKENASDYIIVHTGDVVDDATKEGNYAEAVAHFKRLTDAGFTVLIAPGNHDHGTGSVGSSEYVKKFRTHFYGTADVAYPIKTIIDDIAFFGLNPMAEELHWYDRLFPEGELGKNSSED